MTLICWKKVGLSQSLPRQVTICMRGIRVMVMEGLHNSNLTTLSAESSHHTTQLLVQSLPSNMLCPLLHSSPAVHSALKDAFLHMWLGNFFTAVLTVYPDVQDCHQRLSAFDLIVFFLCSLIPTLTPPPNNALLANLEIQANS